MKTFKIAVDYRICGTVDVQAEAIEEAMKKAQDCNITEVEDKEYIDGTWQVNGEMSEYFN